MYLGILLVFIAMPLAVKFIFAARTAKRGLVLEVVSSGRVIERRRLDVFYEREELDFRTAGETNVLAITDGSVRMAWADCPGGDCMRARAISRAGEMIVCAPHRLVVRLCEGGRRKNESGLDALSY